MPENTQRRGGDHLESASIRDLFETTYGLPVYAYLDEHTNPVSVQELASHLRDRQHYHGTDSWDATSERALEHALREDWLPRMESAGLLSYNSTTDNVRLTPAGAELDAKLEITEGSRGKHPWPRVFLAVGLLSLLGLLAVHVSLPGLEWLTYGTLLFCSSTVLLALAAAQWYFD